MKTGIRLSIALMAAPLMTGCLNDASDADSGNSQTSQISGIAVDGPIVGARVYADTNNDGSLDAFEPRARTDEYGYFSNRPEFTVDGETVEARNYCEEGMERFCLRVGETAGDVRIRIQGGYDTATGRAFEGSISGIFQIQPTDDTTIRTITPLTSASNNPAAVDGNFWSYNADSLNQTDAYKAMHQHQALLGLAEQIKGDTPVKLDSDPSVPEITAALYGPLANKLAGNEDWWTLSKNNVDDILFEAISIYSDSVTRSDVEQSDLAADLITIRDNVSAARDSQSLGDFTRNQTSGAVRAIEAFVEGRQSGSIPDTAEPLEWALTNIADSNACANQRPERIRIERIATEMGLDLNSRNYCETLGSGSFPDLESVGDVKLNSPDGDLTLSFGDNDELSVTGGPIGEDFGNDEEITGSFSKTTDSQILINVDALDGAFDETASLNAVNDGSENGGAYEYELVYGDDEPVTYSSDTDPFASAQ